MSPDKSKTNINRYNQKATSSFKARFDLLLYEHITDGNKGEITADELDSFEIADHEDSLNEYIHVYWQQESIKQYNIRGKTIDEIYLEMKDWRENNKPNIDSLLKHYVANTFTSVFPIEEFENMIRENQKCEYCNITKEQIDTLIEKKQLYKKHITRGWSLEIDRKAANLEYTKDNCVMCCYLEKTVKLTTQSQIKLTT